MENRKIWKIVADRIYSGFLVLCFLSLFYVGAEYLVKMVVVGILKEQSTVYMVHGDQNTCRGAIDADGNKTTCEEAMKDGNYRIEWNAPNSLRATE